MKLQTTLLMVLGFLQAIPASAQAPVGNLWGVNAQNAVICGDGTQWVTVTGKMMQVSVAADGTVLCEPRSSGGFRFSHPDGGAMTVSTPPWIPARMS